MRMVGASGAGWMDSFATEFVATSEGSTGARGGFGLKTGAAAASTAFSGAFSGVFEGAAKAV
jgi:hypothetical protein